MAVPKILLYYRFTPIADPDAIRLWQRDLCESLGLKGRILISKHGINGTVGGELADVKRYVRKTREYAPFKDIDFKWSEGTGDDFPKLSVRVRDEVVSFGAPGELQVDDDGVIGGGERLTPEQLHELVAERDDVAFFDGRNAFEAAVGRFKDAVVPEVATTRDFIEELDSGKYDHLKQKPVVTYCTGGVRCEVLSALMRDRGFEEVYQLDGGIVRYGETFGDAGLWEGSLYVFDRRKTVEFSEAASVIGRCAGCGAPSSEMENCSDPSCRVQLVSCTACAGRLACEAHATALAQRGMGE
ncbi:rhodanese-related sulfurtransferase [Ruicaihuangia caeni]|uniref:oxygen-dependent tRNA uridine(34) hydroxylase TrhO n=1 Tax=Ruicaihuangia caeni TaxID=3042517 RepID=UPI00338E845F